MLLGLFFNVCNYSEFPPLIIADIPGIIQGSSNNIGLGHHFLRHIMRSKTLLYIIDMSNESPYNDWLILRNELNAYHASLIEKNCLIIANKCDLKEAFNTNFEAFKQAIENEFSVSNKVKPNIIAVSTITKEGIEKATMAIRILMLDKLEDHYKANND